MRRGEVPLTPMDSKSSISVPKFSMDDHPLMAIGHLPLPFHGTFYQDLLYTVIYHTNCFHNLVLGCRNRVIAATPIPDPTRIKELSQLCAQIAKRFKRTHQQDFKEFYQTYPKQKRDRYMRGEIDLISMPPTLKHGKCTVFVKPDKIDPMSKPFAVPRLIQFRDPRYAVELASYLKPIEEQVYKWKFKHPLVATNTRMIAKGMNQLERARVARIKWEAFKHPIGVVLDVSRFDMHVNKSLLSVEHQFYNIICNDPRLRKLLMVQLKNLCKAKVKYSDEALRYVTSGRRMSGDMNTALGNCILMLLMTTLYCLSLKIKFDLLDDGDDIILFTEHENYKLVESTAVEFYLKYGMKLKVEGFYSHFAQINFCQSCPIQTGSGWKFVRNPIKIMSTSLSGPRFANVSEKYLKRITAGQGLCEAILNAGVPVLASYSQALMRNTAQQVEDAVFDMKTGTYLSYLREKQLYDRQNSTHRLDQPITIEARTSFEIAFNISISDQLEMENLLDNWTIDFTNHVSLPDRFDVKKWCFNDCSQMER
jgi:hypothetical protein